MEALTASSTPRRPKSCIAPDICHRGDMVKQRWEVLEKLGAGTFGQVYKVLDLKTGAFWALKVEAKGARKPVLRMDVAIARALNGKRHAATFFACGHENQFSYMVTQLLGKNLATRKRTSHEGRFPLRTVIRIGVQTLWALRDLHQIGYLHRDIKPSNLATGVGDRDRIVYLLDFGLARKYLDEKNHIFPAREKVNFRGTIRYASPKAHQQKELGRADDIWSLLYSLIDLYIGHLPWHSVRDMKQVGEMKVKTLVQDLCHGLPMSWRQIYNYCKDHLGYETVPDYEYITKLMNCMTETKKTGIIDLNTAMTAVWEWDPPSNEASDESN